MELNSISPSDLPSGNDVKFFESSYFVNNNELPSPEEVQLRAEALGEDWKGRPAPVKFELKKLLVKYGTHITIAEGQCLWLLRKHLSSTVPVPEIYGWCTDGDVTYLYMELVEGDTLETRWPTLKRAEKDNLCAQLACMTKSWRKLEQDPNHKFIGHVAGQPFLDILFEDAGGFFSGTGPLTDVATFHDLFARFSCKPERYSRLRAEFKGLDDAEAIVFTHGDLHRSNILVSKETDDNIRIVSIIDWHQAGWYPSSWEFCKAKTTLTDFNEDWATEFIPKFLPPPDPAYYESFEWIRMAII